MPDNFDALDHPLVNKLQNIARLGTDEVAAIAALPMQVVNIRPGQDIVREGDRPGRSCVVLSGMMCSFRYATDGRRHILGLQIAGDIPDLQSLHLAAVDTNLGTISACRIGFVEHRALLELIEAYPQVADALWRTSLIEAAVGRAWLFASQLPAGKRLAHLLCELVIRSKWAGIGTSRIAFPLTQAAIADACGLSVVHVNRMLQKLRARKLIRLDDDGLEILDVAGLQREGEFNPEYLHFRDATTADVSR